MPQCLRRHLFAFSSIQSSKCDAYPRVDLWGATTVPPVRCPSFGAAVPINAVREWKDSDVSPPDITSVLLSSVSVLLRSVARLAVLIAGAFVPDPLVRRVIDDAASSAASALAFSLCGRLLNSTSVCARSAAPARAFPIRLGVGSAVWSDSSVVASSE
jgi:hypothetical protein